MKLKSLQRSSSDYLVSFGCLHLFLAVQKWVSLKVGFIRVTFPASGIFQGLLQSGWHLILEEPNSRLKIGEGQRPRVSFQTFRTFESSILAASDDLLPDARWSFSIHISKKASLHQTSIASRALSSRADIDVMVSGAQ